MIFVTDLDSTIIYSRRVVNYNDPNFTCIEHKYDKPITYMTNSSLEKIKLLMRKCIVIPSTTRSIEQFNRIELFKSCKYSIVANGGLVLIEGKPDIKYIKQRNDLLSKFKLNAMLGIISNIPNITYTPKIVDNSFIFTKTSTPLETILLLKNLLDTKKWQIHSHRNKLYILPNVISKGIALNYLLNEILKYSDSVICAGNDELDLSMLKNSDIPIIPFGSNLADQIDAKVLGKNNFASDSILEFALNYHEKKITG